MSKLSAASKRALSYTRGPEWFCDIRTSPISGDLAECKEGIIRRDPSAIIKVDDLYHVWYTRSTGLSQGFGTGDLSAKTFPWDQADIWHATSKDGWHWQEQAQAVARGENGSYDGRSVFTPEVLAYDGNYYLVYQVVEAPYVVRVKEKISIAVANSPFGPWRKLPGPILEPSDDGQWMGLEDNRFLVKSKGSFDSHKTHDPCLMFYKNKFYLYYKGEPMGEEMFFGGRESKWGVAIANKPEGPYFKNEENSGWFCLYRKTTKSGG